MHFAPHSNSSQYWLKWLGTNENTQNDLKFFQGGKERGRGGGGLKCIALPVNNLNVEIAIMKKHSIGRGFRGLF